MTREVLSVVPFAIGSDGEITALSEPESVEDPNGRVPNGAAYLRPVVGDEDEDEDDSVLLSSLEE